MRRGYKHTPEERAAQLARMRTPEMRQKISERTKAGMAKAAPQDVHLIALRACFRAAPQTTRERFTRELLASVLEART